MRAFRAGASRAYPFVPGVGDEGHAYSIVQLQPGTVSTLLTHISGIRGKSGACCIFGGLNAFWMLHEPRFRTSASASRRSLSIVCETYAGRSTGSGMLPYKKLFSSLLGI